MWPYWLIFMVCAVAAATAPPALDAEARLDGRDRPEWTLGWIAATCGIALLIGFRFRVGGDWDHYTDYLYEARGLSISEIVTMADPAYKVANWLSNELDAGIVGVNLLCGALLAIGLTRFCQGLPRPWLALTVSVPYLIVVVGMGYSRQGVALGLAMAGLVALEARSTLWFVVWVILGAAFHKTAVLLLPIAVLAGSRNRYWTLVWVGMVTLWAYGLFLEDSVQSLYSGYLEAQYQSEGALVRILMNAIPATLLLLFQKRFRFAPMVAPLWRWIALISLALLAVLFVSPSSTAVDRIALYMLPLQLVVFSHLPDVVGSQGSVNRGWTMLVVSYYAAVLFVWLNYASHAHRWVPYRLYPFEAL